MSNCEITPQAKWLIEKSCTKARDGAKASFAIYSPLDPIFYALNKANIIADCLENQFTGLDLGDCDHRRHGEAQVEDLLATVDEDIPVNFRLCDISKEV